MFRNKKSKRILSLIIGVTLLLGTQLSAFATEAGSSFMSGGIAALLNPSNHSVYLYEAPAVEEALDINQKILKEQRRIGEELAMANVQTTLNVRAEASETAAKVGILYKDCGGTILDRTDGWIKIRSGDVVGWAKEEYLFTGEEAQERADEVGNWVATIETDVVRVRKEPDLGDEVDVLGLIAYDDGLNIIEVIDEEWICVDYEGNIGYVAAEYINVIYYIDEGETMAVIKAREAAEAERKRTANRGRVDASADELRLLGALIYCEAGNQPYDGKVAVGAVVMNRVRSKAYPNTIHSVIYASGQFTPALNGKVARIYERGVPQSCLDAAQAALDGETTVGGATYFRRTGYREGIVIGGHVFW